MKLGYKTYALKPYPTVEESDVYAPVHEALAARRVVPRQHQRHALQYLLLVLTVGTTMAAGATLAGADVFRSPLEIWRGWSFCLTLMAILGTHELGHYIASRVHGVAATWPYFIPAPTLIGTFGAFIKIRSPIGNKNALFDIGAAGPLAGFVVAIPSIVVGLAMSDVTSGGVGMLTLGSSLIFDALSRLVVGELPAGADIVMHPVAFAGWIGLLVTALNLLPVGQLDGGHIVYALAGERHRLISIVTIPILVILGELGWEGWYIWAGLLLLMTFRNASHPRLIDEWSPLHPARRILGLVMIVIFVVTFIPVPFTVH